MLDLSMKNMGGGHKANPSNRYVRQQNLLTKEGLHGSATIT